MQALRDQIEKYLDVNRNSDLRVAEDMFQKAVVDPKFEAVEALLEDRCWRGIAASAQLLDIKTSLDCTMLAVVTYCPSSMSLSIKFERDYKILNGKIVIQIPRAFSASTKVPINGYLLSSVSTGILSATLMDNNIILVLGQGWELAPYVPLGSAVSFSVPF